jgi:coatomer protein complex subunit gamma
VKETDFPTLKYNNQLKLQITEIDIDTKEEMGNYDEDYPIDSFSLQIRDYIKPMTINDGHFSSSWDQMGKTQNAREVINTFQLPFKTIEDATKGCIGFFGMHVCEGSNKPNVTEKVHNLLLSGNFMGQNPCLVKATIGFKQEYGCVLKLTVRSMSEQVCQTLLSCIQ